MMNYKNQLDSVPKRNSGSRKTNEKKIKTGIQWIAK